MVDLRILKDRQLAASVIFGMVLGFALYSSVFALPVFLQSLLGFGAWDTGKVILPGAIASAITMAVVGRLGNRVDARAMIIFGVGLFAWSMWLHAHLTTDSGLGRPPVPDDPARHRPGVHLRAPDRSGRGQPGARARFRRAPASTT